MVNGMKIIIVTFSMVLMKFLDKGTVCNIVFISQLVPTKYAHIVMYKKFNIRFGEGEEKYKFDKYCNA